MQRRRMFAAVVLTISLSGMRGQAQQGGPTVKLDPALDDIVPAGGIWIVSPEGKHLGTVLTPDRVSNLAFGDPDGKALYMTLHNALYRIRLKNEGVRP